MFRQEKRSFGKYFDDQRDKIVQDMQTGKNAELYNAWRKDYDERQMTKKRNNFAKTLWQKFRHKIVKPKKGKGSFKRKKK